MNKNCEQAKSASSKSRQKVETESSIRNLNLNSIPKSKLPKELSQFKSEMVRGAAAKIMEIIRRRRKSPETLRLVESRLEIFRPGTMRRNFDMNAQRQIWVPSRPNKKAAKKSQRSTANCYRGRTDNNPSKNEQKRNKKLNSLKKMTTPNKRPMATAK